MKKWALVLAACLIVAVSLWVMLGLSPKEVFHLLFPPELTKPKIIVETQYREVHWHGYPHEYDVSGLTEVDVLGDYIVVYLHFDRPMNMKSVEESVTISNIPLTSFSHEENLVARFNFGKLSLDEHTLTISKNIKDSRGQTLEEDIEIEIHVKEDPKASFTILGESVTLTDVAGYSEIHEYDVGDLHLTSSPKTINIGFSKDVNRESVEKSIRNDLDVSLRQEFTWFNDRQLQLRLSGFADKQKLHNIRLIDAVDVDGYQILGGLWFVTAAANEIGYIDLGTYESQIISEIKDQRFEIKPMPTVGDYLILDNSRHQYIYNLAENRITSTYPLKDLYKNRDTGWLDSHTTIFFEWENKMLYKYSFEQDQLEEFFPLATLSSDPLVSTIRVAPDGEKVAVLFCSQMEPDKFDLLLLSSSGEVIKHISNGFFHVWNPSEGPDFNISWVDNRFFLVDDQAAKDSIRRISQYDTETGEIALVLEDAHGPLYDQASNILKFKRENYFNMVKIGEQIIKTPFEGWQYSDFHFIDENHLVLNKFPEIVLYNIAENTYTIIGTGRIIGLSADRTRLYYMTNFISLWYYI